MVISDKHQYLFVELPRTGSTAISKELRELYEGERFLFKHATYSDFVAVATDAQKNYYVFSGIRNPIDDATSLFYKLKNDHREQFGILRKVKGINRLFILPKLNMYNYIQNNDPDFSDYFLKYYRFPFSNWSVAAHRNFDGLIRFEHIQDDFAKVLSDMGIEQVRPLPVVNKTEKAKAAADLYNDAARKRAVFVFGPFMKEWGYEFPDSWGNPKVPWTAFMLYNVLTFFRRIYWDYIRAYVHARLHPERPNKWSVQQEASESN